MRYTRVAHLLMHDQHDALVAVRVWQGAVEEAS